MNSYVALLRAVNVGGTGKLPMTELKAMCEKLGFQNVKTYIASGNVVFTTDQDPEAIREGLEASLKSYAGKDVGVHVRSAAAMAKILADNPFPNKEGRFTVAIFMNEGAHGDMLDGITGRQDEEVKLGASEIYVHYGSGMGRSKLKIPAAKSGTARNMNTIAKLAEMLSELPEG